MAYATDLRKTWGLVWETGEAEPLKVGDPLNGNPESSPEKYQPGRCRD